MPAILLPQLESSCDSGSCHVISPLQEFPPTSGKHSWHLNKFKQSYNSEIDSSICHNCHWDYYYDIQHRNNFIEGYDHINQLHKPGRITRFGGAYGGPGGLEVSATFNTETDNCDNIACHPGPTLNWYRSDSNQRFWNFYCTDCHKPGSAIDPLLTNGSGSAGKHVAHVALQKIKCETCHLGYRKQSTHMNGQYGTKTGARLVYFNDASNLLREDGTPSPLPGRFAQFEDLTDSTGEFNCSSGCHDQGNWYSDQNDCQQCHSLPQDNGDNIPPGGRRAIIPEFPTTDSHSHQGLTLDATTCLVCHDQSTHMDGVVDLWEMDNQPANAVNKDGVNVFRFVKSDDFMVPPSEDPGRNYSVSTYINQGIDPVSFYSTTLNISDFCLGCHDSDGPTRPGVNSTDPFAAGNIPPDVKQYFSGNVSWVEDIAGYGGSQRVTNSHHDVLRADQICPDGTLSCSDANGNPPSGARLDCTGCHSVHMASLTIPVIEPHNKALRFPFNTSPPPPYVVGIWKRANSFCLRCHSGGRPEAPSFPGTIRAGIISNHSSNTASFTIENWTIIGTWPYDPYWVNAGDFIFADWNGTTNSYDSKAIILESFTRDTTPCTGVAPGVTAEGYGCQLDQIWDDIDGNGIIDNNHQADDPNVLLTSDWILPETKTIQVQIVRGNFSDGEQIYLGYCSQFEPSCPDPTEAPPAYPVVNWSGDIEYNGSANLRNPGGVTNLLISNEPVTILRGLDSPFYTAPPWSVTYPWSFDHHGGDSKRQWTNQLYPGTYSNALHPDGTPIEYDVLCLSCHHHHGSNSDHSLVDPSSNMRGNRYMIRDVVDGSLYVDDGSREAYGSNLFYLPAQPYGSATGCDPASENCSVILTDPGLINPTQQPGWENLCYKCHFRQFPFNPLQPNTNSAHAGGGWGALPCMNCHQHGGIANRDNWILGDTSQSYDITAQHLVGYCGNGIIDVISTRYYNGNFIDIIEYCDDGNNIDGDGCSATCQVEYYVAFCGNGIVELGESCDDGNLISGDGCSANCTSPVQALLCGNGVLDYGEQCDDGNAVNSDGCRNNCTINSVFFLNHNLIPLSNLNPAELTQAAVGFTSGIDPNCKAHHCHGNMGENVCGDGKTLPPEECDDGNLISGDGCSCSCKKESPLPLQAIYLDPTCFGPINIGRNLPLATCGNGIKEVGEECDDGNTDNCDLCTNDCRFRFINTTSCLTTPYVNLGYCGNGTVEPHLGEECDRGIQSFYCDGCVNCKKYLPPYCKEDTSCIGRPLCSRSVKYESCMDSGGDHYYCLIISAACCYP